MQVYRRVAPDELAVAVGEAVLVEHGRVEQLAKGQGLEQPAAEPPRPLAVLALPGAPDQALALGQVPAVLERLEEQPEGDAGAHRRRRVDAERQPGKGGADGGRVGRREGRRRARVAAAERLDRGLQEVGAEAREEAEEQAVEEEDARQREGESEGGRLVEWLLLRGRAIFSVWLAHFWLPFLSLSLSRSQ